MQHGIHPNRRTRVPTAGVLAAAALVAGVLAAGCGGSSPSQTAATGHGASASGPSSTGLATSAGSSAATNQGPTSAAAAGPDALHSAGLAFAKCMRSNGVPNFPDPSPGGGLLFSTAGVNPAAPAVTTARAKCQKLLPSGGPAAPGSTTHPSAQTMAKLLTIARCMRQHGIAEFPDPKTSVPPNPFGSGYSFITDYDGAILLFPSTLDRESPAYTQATAACGALAEKLGRGPH
jgi:hypothetical protein